MTVVVDPEPRDSAGKRAVSTRNPASTVTEESPAVPELDEAEATEAPPRPGAPAKLAEPPIPGGRVEALMGRLIKVLAHSPLARPLPAVTLCAVGLLGVAFVGLCATVPKPSVATPPVVLPLTALAQRLGIVPRHLGDDPADVIMYSSIALCCLGLAMMLWANSHGWSPNPRKVFWTAAAACAVLASITPVGSADIASYASYGRLAALGQNPYAMPGGPAYLPGGNHNPYTAIVNPMWRETPSVYGPIATWIQWGAARIGGPRPWLTIWVLMIATALAFLATGYVLLRTADNPVRATLMWVANPLLIVELVMGGHLDAMLALVAITAIVVSRRCRKPRHDILVGLLVGLAGGIKISVAYVALGIAIPIVHDREWGRLVRTFSVAGLTTAALYYFSWGFGALKPLGPASRMIISPTIWRVIQLMPQYIEHLDKPPAIAAVIIGYCWEPIMLALAWYLYNRLSPDVPTVVVATCALTFAWAMAANWSLPWYTSIAWVTLALLPRNSLTRWLTIGTGTLAMMHFNGGWPASMPVAPSP
jgi:hypothetical protein